MNDRAGGDVGGQAIKVLPRGAAHSLQNPRLQPVTPCKRAFCKEWSLESPVHAMLFAVALANCRDAKASLGLVQGALATEAPCVLD